jgi:carbamoyl-phosphate synthase large subunit
MQSRAVTILVTAAGSAPAQAFIRAMRAQSELTVKLVGVDTTARSAGLFDCDGRYIVPPVDDPELIPAIAAICGAEAVEVLAPIANFELQLFADAAQLLEADHRVKVLSSAPQAVALALDKPHSARAVAGRGVAVPAFHEPSASASLPYPVVVKPAAGAGSEGVTVVRDPRELAAALAGAGDRPVVQDFIEGPEYTVDAVIAPDGGVLALAPRIRVEVRAGQSYKAVTVDDPEIEDAARRCLEALGLTAQANVQLIRSERDGRCYFIECNPKFAAAMGLTIGAGLNIPLLQVKLALGVPVRADELRRAPGMWLLRSWNDRVVDEEQIESVRSWEAAAPAARAQRRGVVTPRLR